jgi:hypothetical protein
MMDKNKQIAVADIMIATVFVTLILCITAIILVSIDQHGKNVERDNAVLEGLLAPYEHCEVVDARAERNGRDTRVVVVCTAEFRGSE